MDQVQRTVSYRVEPGEVTTAAVGSDAALRKLAGFKVGQQVKLKCHTPGDDAKVIVEDAKKAKNGPKWWLWGIITLAAAGAVWLLLLFNASD